MYVFRSLLPTVALVLTLANPGFAEDKAARKPQPVNHQANLAQVPATDPKPEQVVALAAGMEGQHPRLLFTLKEVAALQEMTTKDPLLKQAAEDVIAWATSYKAPKGTPSFIKEDTPAIWLSGGTYPGLAYAYHLSKDAAIKHTIVAILTTMLKEPYWADNPDLDCTMGAGNNMLMVGILFDAVHDELEPGFRSEMAAKILTHVRRMWYLGHQERAVKTTKYWQQDPQNNHRWHRNAGLASCLLAIADEPGLETGYLLEQLKGELDFIHTWLPPEGDCHEGATYQSFGFMYLALALRMADRVLGTTYQDHPALRHAWTQQLYYWAPGRNGHMSFGDASNGTGGNFDRTDAAFFIGPQLSRDKLAQAALKSRMESLRAAKPDQTLPWTMLTFYDPTVGDGDPLDLPTHAIFPDLGAASMRDSWKTDAVALTFKCGPYGGHKLNEFANHTGTQTYINVAHDDPDANSFSLTKAGEFIFHPGTYSMPKMTETISTLLVDGKGQVNEGSGYTQPVKNVDMRTLAYLTAWQTNKDGRLIIEGEAGRTYEGRLSGFRRTVLWLPGEYILLLDDVSAEKEHAITWIGVTEKGQIVDATAGTALASGKAGTSVSLQVLADVPLEASITAVQLPARRSDTALDQIRFTAKTTAARIACLLDPWERTPALVFTKDGDKVTLTVTLGGETDTWTWAQASDAHAPSSIKGTRGGKPLLTLTSKDPAPAVK